MAGAGTHAAGKPIHSIARKMRYVSVDTAPAAALRMLRLSAMEPAMSWPPLRDATHIPVHQQGSLHRNEDG